MSDFVYLIRNGDLYKIGQARKLDIEMNRLNPDEIIIYKQINQAKVLEARLFKRYKVKRVPETEYFRLSEKEIEDCKKQLGENSQIPLTIDEEFKITFNASILLSLLSSIFSFFIGGGFLVTVFISLLTASIPMWILFLLGNFGGFDSRDLPRFSTFINRLKAISIAISMNSIAYIVYNLSVLSM